MTKSERNTGGKPGALVSQPHGGAIKRGDNHGNKGGGRPRNEIRELLRKDLAAAREQLRERLDAGTLTFTEIVKYAEFAGRYTVPAPRAGYDKALIDELYSVVEKSIEGLDDALEIMQRIEKRWRQILAKKLVDLLA